MCCVLAWPTLVMLNCLLRTSSNLAHLAGVRFLFGIDSYGWSDFAKHLRIVCRCCKCESFSSTWTLEGRTLMRWNWSNSMIQWQFTMVYILKLYRNDNIIRVIKKSVLKIWIYLVCIGFSLNGFTYCVQNYQFHSNY